MFILAMPKHKNAIPILSNFSLSFPSIDACVTALLFEIELELFSSLEFLFENEYSALKKGFLSGITY